MDFGNPTKYHIQKDDLTNQNPYPKHYCGLDAFHNLPNDIVRRNAWGNQVSRKTLMNYKKIICKRCFKAHLKVLDVLVVGSKSKKTI